MTKSKLQLKEDEIKHLDDATKTIIQRIDHNDKRLRAWAFATLIILLVLGVVGIFRQNEIASDNQNHIDCIVKLLATPSNRGQTRTIQDLETCQIKVN